MTEGTTPTNPTSTPVPAPSFGTGMSPSGTPRPSPLSDHPGFRHLTGSTSTASRFRTNNSLQQGCPNFTRHLLTPQQKEKLRARATIGLEAKFNMDRLLANQAVGTCRLM